MQFLRIVAIVLLVVSSIPVPVGAVGDEAAEMQVIATEQQSDNSENESNGSTTEPTPSPLPSVVPSPLGTPLITEIQTAGDDEFVELYNPNDQPLELTGLSLWYRGSGANVTQLVDLGAVVMQPKAFAVFGHVTTERGVAIGFAKVSSSLNDTVGEVFIGQSTAGSDMVDKVAWGNVSAANGYIYDTTPAQAPPKGNSLQRCFVGGEVRLSSPRDTSQEFLVYSNELPTPFVGIECPVPEPPQPVNACEGIRINEIAANASDQFVELRNGLDRDVSLDGCQLQTNRSMTKLYVFGAEVLPANGLKAVYVKDTPLTLTKTTSGIVYVLSSDGQTEVDVQAYTNLASGTSWSWTSETGWAQTYAMTPNAQNAIQKYLPCEEGYVRNEDTGRCNKIVVPTLVADCGEGKYRSDETGRCRAIPVASVLAACKLGQYRSEDTNRCRNIVTASTLKPCKDNQYRSEETNRCRTITATSVPAPAFAVQPVKDSAMAFVGWWALGGVGLLAAGYGAWEWRQEAKNAARRIANHFSAKR